MKFDIHAGQSPNINKYFSKDIEIAREFAKKMYHEFGNFLQGIILFGSTISNPKSAKKDIDLLIVLDDIRVKFSKELVETYRIITEKVVSQTDPKRLHIQSMKFTTFWEYVRAGDPVAINILRSGLPLVDTGFFTPLQSLLEQGRIRPSFESIYTYYSMAPQSMTRSKQHLLEATMDLYWAAIDAAHAALMSTGEVPPSPDHIADLLERRLVANKHLTKRHAEIMRELYLVSKKIVHRDIKEISGKQYDELRKKTEFLLKAIKGFIEKRTFN